MFLYFIIWWESKFDRSCDEIYVPNCRVGVSFVHSEKKKKSENLIYLFFYIRTGHTCDWSLGRTAHVQRRRWDGRMIHEPCTSTLTVLILHFWFRAEVHYEVMRISTLRSENVNITVMRQYKLLSIATGFCSHTRSRPLRKEVDDCPWLFDIGSEGGGWR